MRDCEEKIDYLQKQIVKLQHEAISAKALMLVFAGLTFYLLWKLLGVR